jgi:homoserine dehydrogenase
MSDVAAIRTVFPRHTAKMVSMVMGVPVNTAREWIYRHFSAARRRGLALTLLAEMDRQDAERANLRQHLQSIAGEQGHVEVGGDTAGAAVQSGRGTGAGATPTELGRDVVVPHHARRGAR